MVPGTLLGLLTNIRKRRCVCRGCSLGLCPDHCWAGTVGPEEDGPARASSAQPAAPRAPNRSDLRQKQKALAVPSLLLSAHLWGCVCSMASYMSLHIRHLVLEAGLEISRKPRNPLPSPQHNYPLTSLPCSFPLWSSLSAPLPAKLWSLFPTAMLLPVLHEIQPRPALPTAQGFPSSPFPRANKHP